jgi:5'-nucleotidase
LATGLDEGDYLPAAQFAARLARTIFENGLPADTFLNVNVPDTPGPGLLAPLITRQGKRHYEGLIIDKVDPRGRKYYWIGNGQQNFMDIEGTDYFAVSRGYISVTPLHLDLTNYNSMDTLNQWKL